MSIQFIDLKAQYQHLKADIDARIHAVLDHGQYIMGPEVKEVEAQLAAYTGAKHAIGVCDGTKALLIALMALGVKAGDEVITTPFTFFATAGTIHNAGATPVFVDVDSRISIPVDGTPSTHILKPDTKRLAGSVENEAFCLALASACGLKAAEATIGVAGKRRYLLVRRYDRFTDPQGEIRRLHQEDLCQLTGHFASQKYERSSTGSGVTLKMMFNTISDLVSPGERLTFLDAVIFNVLICNSDSHAKNYSILIGAGGSAKMAPLYDLMCAAVYRQVDQSLPQGIAGRFNATELRRAHWLALAEEIGLSGASTVRRVEELATSVSFACRDVAPQIHGMVVGQGRVLENIIHYMQKRCRRIAAQCRA